MNTLIEAVEELIANQKQHIKYENEEISRRQQTLDQQRARLFSLEQDLKTLKVTHLKVDAIDPFRFR